MIHLNKDNSNFSISLTLTAKIQYMAKTPEVYILICGIWFFIQLQMLHNITQGTIIGLGIVNNNSNDFSIKIIIINSLNHFLSNIFTSLLFWKLQKFNSSSIYGKFWNKEFILSCTSKDIRIIYYNSPSSTKWAVMPRNFLPVPWRDQVSNVKATYCYILVIFMKHYLPQANNTFMSGFDSKNIAIRSFSVLYSLIIKFRIPFRPGSFRLGMKNKSSWRKAQLSTILNGKLLTAMKQAISRFNDAICWRDIKSNINKCMSIYNLF